MKKLILAVALLAVMTVPAMAAVQNVQVEGNVNSFYLFRENFDFVSTNYDQQSIFFTTAILQVGADLTDNVRAVIRLINERVWEEEPGTSNSDVDVNLAFVELRELLYSPLTVIIGRQDWRYGNSFIFDSAGTNDEAPSDSGIDGVAVDLTAQTALDAIRFILDYNPLVIEAFFALQDHNTVALSDIDDDLYYTGLNATYKVGDSMDTVVEGYLFTRTDKSDTTGSSDYDVDFLKIVGGRFSTNPLEGLNLQGEIAHQGGTISDSPSADNDQSRDAWGFQGIVNYKVPALKDYNPVLQYVFTKVYGNTSTTTDEEYTAWDPMRENQGGGTIYNTLFSLSGAIIHTISLSANPMEDVTSKLSVTKLLMTEDVDATSMTINQPDTGTAAPTILPGSARELGVEVDFETKYDYTEDVQFGLNVGVFKPNGSLFLTNENAKQVIANVNVAF